MNNNFDEELHQVAEETFGSLAFMMPIDEEESTAADGAPGIGASVAFAGPFRGVLFLTAPGGMLPELAANMLGLDDQETPSAEKQHDALRELLNVVCGNLLPIIAGPEAVFDVRAPEILDGGGIPATIEQRGPAGTARLFLDSGQVELAIFIDGQLPDG